MEKKRLIKQDNGQTALHRATKGPYPSSLKSIVSSTAWIPSPSLRLHTGPGLQTKTSTYEDDPWAKSHMTWKIVMPRRKRPWNKGSPSYRRKCSVKLVTSRIISRRTAQKKRTCKKCKRPHPTLLHIEGFSLDKESGAVNRETTGNDKPQKVNN